MRGTAGKRPMSGRAAKGRAFREDPQRDPCIPPSFDRESWQAVLATLGLSRQQGRIVGLVVRGMQDKQIASELGLAYGTIRTYLERISVRLGVDSRIAMVVRVFEAARRLSPQQQEQRPRFRSDR